MYLITFGTRPELIKLIPLILKFKEKNILYLTLFTGQHETLIDDFTEFIPRIDIRLKNIMEKDQSLNKLISKIIIQTDELLKKFTNITHVIVHGDTSSAYAIALSSFHYRKQIIHLEAGLRTHSKYSPFPEEMNRRLISQISDIHLCPTERAVDNLLKENITTNVYNVGNTIVDMYKNMTNKFSHDYKLIGIPNTYLLVTLHRRENRGNNMLNMWAQLNNLSSKYHIIYISHPSLPESKIQLLNEIAVMEPQNYTNMFLLINNSMGIITDSGGIQEEAVCAGKKVLICRDSTERPETIECGLGKLIGTEIENNIDFFKEKVVIDKNPFGENVVEKICNILPEQWLNV